MAKGGRLMSMVCDAHKHSPVEHKEISLTLNTSSQGSPIRLNAHVMIILCHPSPPFTLLRGAHDFAYQVPLSFFACIETDWGAWGRGYNCDFTMLASFYHLKIFLTLSYTSVDSCYKSELEQKSGEKTTCELRKPMQLGESSNQVYT